jgi:hypothetical protein
MKVGDEAFNQAWDVVKGVLPDLPFDMDLDSYKDYFHRNNVNYKAHVTPDVARKLLAENPYSQEYINFNSVDQKKFDKKMKNWDKELTLFSDLFENPENVLSRITGLNGNEFQMPYQQFSEYATRSDRDDFSDLEIDPINAYIDYAEDADRPVVVGGGDYNLSRNKINRVMVNPGFQGRNIAQHIMGSMLQDNKLIRDNLFSVAGYNAFQSLGNKLTRGGEVKALPYNLGSHDWGSGILDTTLGDVVYTQPYGGKRRVNRGGGEFFESDDGWEWQPDDPYPLQYNPIMEYPHTNPKVVGRYPMAIRYKGNDPNFVTNLGRRDDL